MSTDDRNTDLTPAEMTHIIDRFWPSRVDRKALHQMLQAAADRALEKYLGNAEPMPPLATEITYPDLHTADLEISTYRAPGTSGGFGMNRVETAVRITHLPTGLQAEAWEDRSQHKNKAVAYAELKRKVALHVRQPEPDPKDPHPDKTDAELGFAYRMMLRAAHNGLVVNFISGDISLPKKG